MLVINSFAEGNYGSLSQLVYTCVFELQHTEDKVHLWVIKISLFPHKKVLESCSLFLQMATPKQSVILRWTLAAFTSLYVFREFLLGSMNFKDLPPSTEVKRRGRQRLPNRFQWIGSLISWRLGYRLLSAEVSKSERSYQWSEWSYSWVTISAKKRVLQKMVFLKESVAPKPSALCVYCLHSQQFCKEIELEINFERYIYSNSIEMALIWEA